MSRAGPGRAADVCMRPHARALRGRYVSETFALLGDVETYLSLDVYDPARAPLSERIKKEGNSWAGAYAPGGSCKRESGRAFYNGLNQLQGHFVTNGLGPLGKATLEKARWRAPPRGAPELRRR